MIQKYTYGTPFETDAIVTSIPASEGTPAYGTISTENGFSFTYDMDYNDVVYGLGESNRGINKRGYVYESNCSDQPNHTEDKISLYGAHNFLVISGKQTFGLFVDYPGKLKFDIGYTLSSQLKITCEDADLYLYVIEGETPYDIVKQFRKIIGRSYIPPKFAFGFCQSRWGYTTADDFRKAADGYRENNIPIDMVYMDIDYMEDYKDFTVIPETVDSFGNETFVFLSEPCSCICIQDIREMSPARPYSGNEITAVFTFAEVVLLNTFFINIIASLQCSAHRRALLN